MISRLCLAVEYASTLWHVRKYKKARLPLYVQIALHLCASAVYFGISFRFRVGERSRVYMTWYFISGAEAIGSLLLSNFSPVVSLTKTHLMKRMTLLTVMIMGDGIVQVAKEVVIIVKNPDAWGKVTASLRNVRNGQSWLTARYRLDNHWSRLGSSGDNLLRFLDLSRLAKVVLLPSPHTTTALDGHSPAVSSRPGLVHARVYAIPHLVQDH